MTNLKIYVQTEIRDGNGKVIKRIRKRLCHSYVQQLIDMLRDLMSGSSGNVVDTGGTSRAMVISGTDFSFYAGAGVAGDTYGIQVGTSNSAVTISQYSLVAKISNGSSSGQLSYGLVSVGATATVGTTRQFTIARTFTNNSGADITVNEVDLVLIVLLFHNSGLCND